ncbi:MAG: diphthine synthase, partial [Candidatus Nanoarchaeia archaeon]
PAKGRDVAFLVIGDPMGATTHTDMILRAKKEGVEVEVINNTSILNAVGIVGLELYKYGKTASIVLPQECWKVQTHYDVIKENQARGLHTLCLLDIKQDKCMTINEALKDLLKIESERREHVISEDTLCVGCARLGSSERKILAGTIKHLLEANFGPPLHSLIIPGKLHFIEEEALELWKSL